MSRPIGSPLQPLPAEQVRARARLFEVLEAALADGQQIPCLGLESGHWTSEDRDERIVAARACRSCPALEVCRAYGQAWPNERGVYGADPRITRPKKETAA